MNEINPNQESDLVQITDTMYSNLPDDLRDRMIKATDQMLNIGDNDLQDNQILTDWSERAVDQYKLMGISEEKIAQKVNQRLENFLTSGRGHGLSSNMGDFKLLMASERNDSQSSAPANDFQAKYDIAHFRQIKLLLGEFDFFDTLSYRTSLRTAFNLAAKIGNHKKAFESYLHMIRLGNFETAYKTAEKMGDDRTLLNLGKLALTDFFDGKNGYHASYLHDTIESVKRIQGESKPEAEKMLYDLAMEISSPEFIRMAAINTYDPFEEAYTHYSDNFTEYALRALRVTGELVERKPIDSGNVDFSTKITDEKYVAAIKDLTARIMSESLCPDLDEVRNGLQAIGDIDALNQYAEEVFEQRYDPQGYDPNRFYSQAFDFFKAAGNTQGMRKVIDAEMDEGIAELRSFDYELSIVPRLAEIGYTDRLKQIQSSIAHALTQYREQSHERDSWKNVGRKVENALAGKPLEIIDEIEALVPKDEVIPSYVRDAMIEEIRFRKSLEESRAKLTPESREQLVAQGYGFLEQGDSWNAYICFQDALHRKGLIEAGDKMIEQNNGLNAKTPYLFASMLPIEETALPQGIERKLIE